MSIEGAEPVRPGAHQITTFAYYDSEPRPSSRNSTGRVVTYSYDMRYKLVAVSSEQPLQACGSAKFDNGATCQIEIRDASGRAMTWSLTDATRTAGTAQDASLYAFRALANLIDLLPLHTRRWRLLEARDASGDTWRYNHDEETGRIEITAPGGALATFAEDFDKRLVRITDAETGMVEHVYEPTTHEVVFEYDTHGRLVRSHPAGGPRRSL